MIRCEFSSVIAGKGEEWTNADDMLDNVNLPKMLKLWLCDADLQAITLCSTNIGFVRTWTKSFNQLKGKK